MSKTWKAFLCGTALITLGLLVTACPHKPPVKTVPTTTTAEAKPPEVTIPAHTEPATETVAPRNDFVSETKVQEEQLPKEIEQLNQFVQQKGYIQDAFYDFDASTLSGEAQAALTASATWLKAHPSYNLLLEGHCDERGTEQYNLALGDRRANSARDFLATLGVESSRMRTVSYGEERPFAPGHDEGAWAKNRRAHLVLVK